VSKLFDLEAEYSVLGTMIVQPSYSFRGVELLNPEDFFKEEHRNLFRFVRDLIAEGYTESQLNEISFKDELEKRGLLEKVGGENYLLLLIEYALENYEKFESACKIVKDKSLLRRIVRVGKRINELVEETPDPELLIETLEKEVFSLSEDRVTNSLVHVGEVIPEIISQIEELASRREVVTGLPTGFFQLDQMTSGLQQSDLIILAARPSMGKTAFALSIAYNVAVREGKTVAFFSLEMSKEQLVLRLLSFISHIPLYDLRLGKLTEEQKELLEEATKILSQMPIYIDDTPSLSITDLRVKALRMKKEKDVQLIIVDYLQLLRGIRKYSSRQEEVADISRSLKNLAKELDIPVIALAQLSRQVEQRSDKRPQLADLRESGSIEQDADTVIFLYRPEYYLKLKKKEVPPDLKGKVEIIVAKQRQGPQGVVEAYFIDKLSLFEPKDPTEEDFYMEELEKEGIDPEELNLEDFGELDLDF
jgi:replicative DNA helicase